MLSKLDGPLTSTVIAKENHDKVLTGAYKGKERISHIDTVVLSKNKVTLADSHSY